MAIKSAKRSAANQAAAAAIDVGTVRVSDGRIYYRCTRTVCGHEWVGKKTFTGAPTKFCPECKRKTAQVVER